MNINKLLKNQANLGAAAAILLGILVVVNFLSYQLFVTFDLTQNKDYSISKVTKESVKKLDDIVNIKAYFSADLPTQYVNLPQQVRDILTDYQAFSGGKIKFEFIDPKDDQKMAQELQLKGIPQLQFNVLEKDKYQVVNGYLGMSIQYADKTEVIPVIQDTNNLEYQITSKIKKVTAKEAPVVGFISSNDTLKTDSEIKEAYRALSAIYDVQSVDLTVDKTVPDSIKTLIVAGAKKAFGQGELDAIDKFVMRGGSLLVLMDQVDIGQNLAANPNTSGLGKLLEGYGVNVGKNLVLDVSSGMASFNQGFMTYNLPYPYWPKILKTGFDKENPAVSRLESLILPWVSSVAVDKGKLGEGAKVSILAKSGERSWTVTEPYNLNPQDIAKPASFSPQDLAVSIAGKISSPYKNGSTDNGRLIVVGDSDFLRDNMLGGGDNLIFFQNLVDSLSLDQDLINIRSKGIGNRPLKELSDSAKATVRYVNVFGLTGLVLAFGLYRYYSRRKQRFEDNF